jgi:hypothetical protein
MTARLLTGCAALVLFVGCGSTDAGRAPDGGYVPDGGRRPDGPFCAIRGATADEIATCGEYVPAECSLYPYASASTSPCRAYCPGQTGGDCDDAHSVMGLCVCTRGSWDCWSSGIRPECNLPPPTDDAGPEAGAPEDAGADGGAAADAAKD